MLLAAKLVGKAGAPSGFSAERGAALPLRSQTAASGAECAVGKDGAPWSIDGAPPPCEPSRARRTQRYEPRRRLRSSRGSSAAVGVRGGVAPGVLPSRAYVCTTGHSRNMTLGASPAVRRRGGPAAYVCSRGASASCSPPRPSAAGVSMALRRGKSDRTRRSAGGESAASAQGSAGRLAGATSGPPLCELSSDSLLRVRAASRLSDACPVSCAVSLCCSSSVGMPECAPLGASPPLLPLLD